MQTEVCRDQGHRTSDSHVPWVHSCSLQLLVFDCLEEYAPGFRKLVVGYDILTPPDLERVFELTGGVSCGKPRPPCRVHTVAWCAFMVCRTSSTEGCCWTSSTCPGRCPPAPDTGRRSEGSTSVGVAATQVPTHQTLWCVGRQLPPLHDRSPRRVASPPAGGGVMGSAGRLCAEAVVEDWAQTTE